MRLVTLTTALSLGLTACGGDRLIVAKLGDKEAEAACTIRQDFGSAGATTVAMEQSGRIASIDFTGGGDSFRQRHEVTQHALIVHNSRNEEPTTRVEYAFAHGHNVGVRVFDEAADDKVTTDGTMTYDGDLMIKSRVWSEQAIDVFGADGVQVATYADAHVIGRTFVNDDGAYVSETLQDVDHFNRLEPANGEPGFFVVVRSVLQRDSDGRPLESDLTYVDYDMEQHVVWTWSNDAVHIEAETLLSGESLGLVTEDGTYDSDGILVGTTYRQTLDDDCVIVASGALDLGEAGDATATLFSDDGCTGTSTTEIDEVERAMFHAAEHPIEESCPGVVPYTGHFGFDALEFVRPIGSFAPARISG